MSLNEINNGQLSNCELYIGNIWVMGRSTGYLLRKIGRYSGALEYSVRATMQDLQDHLNKKPLMNVKEMVNRK